MTHNPKVEGSNPSPATKKLQVRAVQEHRPFFFSGSSGICGESLPDRHLTTIESRTLKLGLPA